jgi:hypothetical protein
MVRFNNGTIMYCIYRGTTDIMYQKLSKTMEETWNNYNKTNDNICDCIGEDVLIYSNYGRGKTYTGKACKEHEWINFDFNNFLECEYNNREIGWDYQNYTHKQMEEEKIKHDEILKNNWIKSGKHFN